MARTYCSAASAKSTSIENIDIDLALLYGGVEQTDDEGLTVRELCENCKHSAKWVYKRLQQAMHEGRIIYGRRKTTSLDGRAITVPVYRPKRKEKK